MMKYVTINGGMSPEDLDKTAAIVNGLRDWLVAHAKLAKNEALPQTGTETPAIVED